MIEIKLAEIMGKHKVNQKYVAEKTGIRPSTISYLWHGKTQRIEIEHINQLCKLFNCQVSDLLEYTPD